MTPSDQGQCSGTAKSCGAVRASCELHGCTTVTVCGGMHPPCSAFGSSSTCMAHGCSWGGVCGGGPHLPCGSYGLGTCAEHGCDPTTACGGQPTPCAMRGQDDCEQGDGCLFSEIGCRGTARPCGINGTCATGCIQALGCGGTPHACSAEANASTCGNAGCTWTNACTGTPHTCDVDVAPACPTNQNGQGCFEQATCAGTAADTCESHGDLVTCGDHPNCTWNLVGAGCLPPPPESCTSDGSGRCPAGCVCQ